MTQAARHTNAPYVDGETLAGADLETDIANAYAVINGSIDDGNIASGANISGTKLADNSVANAKLVADTVTTAKMAASAVPKAYVSASTAGVTLGTTTAWSDVTGITPATLIVGNVGDFIILDFNTSLSLVPEAPFDIGFSVDGTDNGVSSRVPQLVSAGPVSAHYVVAATATGAIVLKPRTKMVTAVPATDAVAIDATARTQFSALIIPIK